MAKRKLPRGTTTEAMRGILAKDNQLSYEAASAQLKSLGFKAVNKPYFYKLRKDALSQRAKPVAKRRKAARKKRVADKPYVTTGDVERLVQELEGKVARLKAVVAMLLD